MVEFELVKRLTMMEERIARLERQEMGHAGVGARVMASASMSIPNNTQTALFFDQERFDTFNMHSLAANNSEMHFRVPGKYIITGHVRWNNVGTGRRRIAISLNNSVDIAVVENEAVASGDLVVQSIATVYAFTVGQYVTLRVLQNSGSALSTVQNNNYSHEFAAYLLP